MSRFEHYPLVERALKDVTAVFSRRHEEVPEELKHITERTLEILEVVFSADDGKESLMAAGVLVNCPIDIFFARRDYAKDYDARVQNMMSTHVSDYGVTQHDCDLIQVYSALCCAHSERLLEKVKIATKKDHGLWLQEVREGLEEYLEERALIAAVINPSLNALEVRTVREIFTAIDAVLRPSLKGPPPKKNQGPGIQP